MRDPPRQIIANNGCRRGVGMRSLILGLLLLTADVAHAETYAVGIGKFSCGKFIASIGKNAPGMMETMTAPDGVKFHSENEVYGQWLLGTVSGVNSALSAYNVAHPGEEQQQIVNIDPAGVDLWMRNWCNQHPVKFVFDAAVAFIGEMRTNATAARR